MKRFIVPIVLLLVFGILSRAEAAVFNVDSVPDLRSALATASANGEDDTINLAPGVYEVTYELSYSPLFWENYSLTVAGAGVGQTILDSRGICQISVFNTTLLFKDTNAHITVRGISFRNGSTPVDGGMLLGLTKSANVTVESSEFTGSSANYGGGVWVSSLRGAVTLANNAFSGNAAIASGSGAWVYSHKGAVSATGNTFSGNSALYGGGIWMGSFTGAISLTDNSFISNASTASGSGAWAYSASGTLTITGNTFSSNAGNSGSGLWAGSDSGPVLLTGNVFSDNSASNAGSGAYVYSTSGDVTLANNAFGSNAARSGSGAWAGSFSGTVTLTNNTVNSNAADWYGAGFFVWKGDEGTPVNIFNNIAWGNSALLSGGDIYVFDDGDVDGTGATVYLYNNDYDDLFIQDGDNLFQGNNIHMDPLLTQDFHLQDGSPAIDAGDNNAPALPDTDFEGDPRIINDTVDMGADEYKGVYLFDGFQSPINEDGSSVFNAGKNVEVKIVLTDLTGAPFFGATVRIAVYKILDGGIEEQMAVESRGGANDGDLFRYCNEGQQYLYNLCTKGYAPGTYKVYALLDNGESHSVTITLI